MCDGSRSALAAKLATGLQARQRHVKCAAATHSAAEGSVAGGGDEGDVAEGAGILDWAHLADPTLSPDQMWGQVCGGQRACCGQLVTR